MARRDEVQQPLPALAESRFLGLPEALGRSFRRPEHRSDGAVARRGATRTKPGLRRAGPRQGTRPLRPTDAGKRAVETHRSRSRKKVRGVLLAGGSQAPLPWPGEAKVSPGLSFARTWFPGGVGALNVFLESVNITCVGRTLP